MPKDTISVADAAAAAVAEAERSAQEAAERAIDPSITAQAQVERIAVIKGGADKIANSRDRAAQLAQADEMAAHLAEQQAAKMAKAATAKMDVGPGEVRVRITALGHGQVFTGEDIGPDGERFPTYHRGAEPPMALSVAKVLCAKGFADFVDE